MPFDSDFDDDGLIFYESPDREASPESFKSALEGQEPESLADAQNGYVSVTGGSDHEQKNSCDMSYGQWNKMPNGNGDVETGEASDAEEPIELITSDLQVKKTRSGLLSTPGPDLSIGTSSTQAVTRDGTPASGTEKKSRARPKGSRSGERVKRAATRSRGPVAPPKPEKAPRTAGGTSRASRRPKRALSPPPRHVYNELKPQFLPFICEWKGCPAELQNFETLQRHVYKVHGASETCMWGRCANAVPPPSLATKDDFKKHMEEKHLTPFVWHTGEGPKNGCGIPKTSEMRGDAPVPPPYLFDACGKQVTPSVRDQRYNTQEEHRGQRRKLAQLRLQRDENAPEEEPMTKAELAELPQIVAKHPRLRWML